MKTVNNLPEDNFKRITIYVIKAIIIALVIWLVIMKVLTSSILEETKHDQQVYEMLEYHSAPDQLTIEYNGCINIVKQ